MDAIVFKDKMWEIKGGSKAKRIAWMRPQNQLSWAFLKMIRESNETRRVYDVNPYTEVYQFRENVYGLFAQNCDGLSDVWQYLIVGPEKAMLIDTAYGLGDTEGLCMEISGGKPLIVVNTHDGPDHCLGNIRYEKVYCYEEEVEAIRAKNVPGCFDYLFDENGNNIWLQFDRKDLPEWKEYELIGVPDHTVFNLGGDHDIELIFTGGHSGGHAVFLDKKSRILFTGDVVTSDGIICGQGPRPGFENSRNRNIETFREHLEPICRRFGEFDYLYPGHGMVGLENHVLLDILDTLDLVLKNPDCYDYTGEKGRLFKFIRNFSTIIYTKEGVYRP